MGWLSRRQPLAGAHNFDSPEVDTRVTTPDVHLRGWFALPIGSRVSAVELIGAQQHRQPIRLCQRDDAQCAHPDYLVVGIDHRVTTQPLVEGERLTCTLRIHCGRHHYDFPLDRDVSHDYASNDGYYASNDHLGNDHEPSGSLSLQQRRHWQDNGYLVLKGFFNADTVTQTHEFIDQLWTNRHTEDFSLSIDAYSGSSRMQRMRFGQAPADVRQQTYKLNDLFVTHAAVRDLVLQEQLSNTINALLGGPPVVCNTLYFEYGSQQDDHFDTFYMPPTVRNKMLATWIALDPANESNGSLRYYPGSHLIEPYVFSNGLFNETTEEMSACMQYIRDELAQRCIEPVLFHAEPGDVFIWHAHLLHGGSAIADPTVTRRSLVTHYFRQCDLESGTLLEHAPGRYYMNRPPAPVALPSHRRHTFEQQVTR